MNTIDFRLAHQIGVKNEGYSRKADAARTRIIAAVWIYLILILLEGALRKWFLPSLSGPLIILRDPLALWILIASWKSGYLNLNYYSISMIIIGFLATYTAFFLGHGNLMVALYGSRIFLLHIPLIFVIASVFDKNEILRIARWTVLITIPMTMLIIVQFYSPQTAWINKSVGGEAGGGFSGAMNFYRPPGIFSFTNGNALFFNFAACFIIYFWFRLKEINWLVLISASIALLLAIPFSISRTLFFQLFISLLFAVVSILLKPKYVGGLIFIIGAVLGIFVLLSFTSYFTTATAAFSSRFETANTIEGGLNGVFFNRFLGGLIEGASISSKEPFFGQGVGLGTNVGSMILTGGRYFLISEGEWGRIIGEIGLIFGLVIIFLRVKLALSILLRSFQKLKHGIILPWMLASVGALSFAQAGWGQPTSLGFCVVITGLVLAALTEGNVDSGQVFPFE